MATQMIRQFVGTGKYRRARRAWMRAILRQLNLHFSEKNMQSFLRMQYIIYVKTSLLQKYSCIYVNNLPFFNSDNHLIKINRFKFLLSLI